MRFGGLVTGAVVVFWLTVDLCTCFVNSVVLVSLHLYCLLIAWFMVVL